MRGLICAIILLALFVNCGFEDLKNSQIPEDQRKNNDEKFRDKVFIFFFLAAIFFGALGL